MRGQPGILLALGLAAAVTMGCSASRPAGDVRDGPAGAGAVRIVADDSFFAPERIELTPNRDVTLEVVNHGDMPHDFSIEELEISTGVIQPGATKTITFEVPKGTTGLSCRLHGGMDGTIVAKRANEG
jgi:hypothetical protein